MPKFSRHVTGAAGAVSAVVGVGLFVVFGAVSLNYYDEKPRPWWLMSLLVIAIGLILGAVLAAIAGTLRQHRQGRLG